MERFRRPVCELSGQRRRSRHAAATALAAACLLVGCGFANANDGPAASDIEVLVWAYGVIPSSDERAALKDLLMQDAERFPNMRREMEGLRLLRDNAARFDTLTYMGRWASVNSRLMAVTPPGNSARYVHRLQANDAGANRYCASSSIDLQRVGILGKTFGCGGYRFLVSAAVPSGRIAEADVSYRSATGAEAGGVDWKALGEEWRVIADPSDGAPIAMRLVGTTLFVSVAPPRRAAASTGQTSTSGARDARLEGTWVWSNQIPLGASSHASIIRIFSASGRYEERSSLLAQPILGRYTASNGHLTIAYAGRSGRRLDCAYAIRGGVLELTQCSNGMSIERLRRDGSVR